MMQLEMPVAVGKIHMKLVTKSKPTAGPFQPRTGLSKSV